MARARRRLHRLKVASAIASVLTFGGLTAGIATHGISSQAVAAATSSSPAAAAPPNTTAAASSSTSATTTAPIVSAQS